MKLSQLSVLILFFSLLISCNSGNEHSSYSQLYYGSSASQWMETLPLGNGRLGMMPDGAVNNEHIVLNEISMWSGSEADYSNPDAGKSLPAIRKLLFEGKNVEAQELMYEKFVPRGTSSEATYGNFQMLADLYIQYDDSSEKPTNYERGLLLESSIAYTKFDIGSNSIERQYFASRDKDVLVVHLKSKNPKSLNFEVKLSRPQSQEAIVNSDGILELTGELESGQAGVKGIEYTTLVDVKALGSGAKKSTNNQTLSVDGADEAWIVVSAATSFFEGENYKNRATELLKSSISDDLNRVKSEAIESYQKLYNRVSLKIEENIEISKLPTDLRLSAFQSSDDPSLAALYYNYGRYLLISSTREGSLPPNLQGLWANGVKTPWNGDYHTNINVQMNHWPAEQANLSELHLPLIDLTAGLVESGEHSAKVFYGDGAKGWVAHMMTNVWNYTAPGSHPSWGATNTGGAWLCAHLWEHYLFTDDIEYLKKVYPIIKGASEFFLSTMVVEPKNGWLVTAPTSSPENAFYVEGSDESVSVCMGPTMDVQLISELFTNVISAAEILGVDKEYSSELEKACKKFPPHQISKEGYLMEWLEDYKEQDINHRHVSHLYGLHPGNQISIANTPELAEACREVLNRRGDGGTGWSRAWKINFWARLGDGDRAYKLFKSLMVPAYTAENPTKHGSGTFPNLFCSHQPFQMDGNWGGTSGISEMLVQSQDGFINFLPSLPSSWSSGELTGFKVRGGAEVSLKWQNNIAVEASITTQKYEVVKIKMPKGCEMVTATFGGVSYTIKDEEYFEFGLSAGEKAKFEFFAAK